MLVSQVTALPLVKIEITNISSWSYESLTVLNPNNENWIKMTGGADVQIPTLMFIYNGINTTSYTKGDKNIKITTFGISENQDYAISYPFTTQPIYYTTDVVTAQLLGENSLAGKTAYVYLIKTYPTQLKNALSSAIDGDTQALRNLLSNHILNTSVTLDSNGDNTSISFGTLNAGDYVVVATLNQSSAKNITLISATAFEVLEHKSSISDITVFTMNGDTFLEGNFTINTSSTIYTYMAALINKENYKINFTLTSKGNKSTTNLSANGANLVESFKIAGVGLNRVNRTIVYNWIRDAFPDNSSVAKERKNGNVWKFSLPITGFPDGVYYLNIAAWNSSNNSQRVVAFSQLTLYLPSVPGLSPPQDLDGDGVFEDVNGNGRLDFDDVVEFFKNFYWIKHHYPPEVFDFNGNGRIDFDDIVELFKMI